MDSKGLPLDFILLSIDKDLFIIDWIDFMNVSIRSNWNTKGTISKLEESFLDYYEKDFSKIIINRLKNIYL